jgi:DNA-3-methyladenine glycosylase II
MSLAASDPPIYWAQACSALSQADPVMGGLIERARDQGHLMSRGDPFATLARSIVGQQISVKAAASVWARFERSARTVRPERVARMRLSTLTAAGLSGRKAEYLRDLAGHFVQGTVDPTHWPDLPDEAIIDELVQVRGIGRWTAEMFLMFNLMRPDVLPLDDLGLLKAVALHYNGGQTLAKAEVEVLAQPWRPWRTVATWMLWRSLDPVPVAY